MSDSFKTEKYQLVRKINDQAWEEIGTPLSKEDLDLLIEVEFSRQMVPSGYRHNAENKSFIGLMPGPNNKAQSPEVSWFRVQPEHIGYLTLR